MIISTKTYWMVVVLVLQKCDCWILTINLWDNYHYYFILLLHSKRYKCREVKNPAIDQADENGERQDYINFTCDLLFLQIFNPCLQCELVISFWHDHNHFDAISEANAYEAISSTHTHTLKSLNIHENGVLVSLQSTFTLAFYAAPFPLFTILLQTWFSRVSCTMLKMTTTVVKCVLYWFENQRNWLESCLFHLQLLFPGYNFWQLTFLFSHL